MVGALGLEPRIRRDCGSGRRPQTTRKLIATAPTLVDVWDRFARDLLSLRKESTQRSYRSIWKDRLKPTFGKHRVAGIGRGDVVVTRFTNAGRISTRGAELDLI